MKKFIVRYGSFVEMVLWFVLWVLLILFFNDVSAKTGPLGEWDQLMHDCYLLGGIVMTILFVGARLARCLFDCWYDWRNLEK